MRQQDFVLKKRMKHTTNEELYVVLKDTFNVDYRTSLVKNNLLTVLYFTGYTTAADLSYYLGMPEKSFKALHKQLHDLEKAGLVTSVDMKAKDCFSKILYYLTDNGFLMASGLMENKHLISFKKRGKASTTMHDYSVGLNVIQMILHGIPFRLSKELSYSSSKVGLKQVGSLCIDAVFDLEDKIRICIEQDLGSEPTGTLIGKLEKYHYYQLFNCPETTAIIFSFRQPYVTIEGAQIPAYSPKKVATLISYCQEQNRGLNEAITGVDEPLKTQMEETKESLVSVFELPTGMTLENIPIELLELFIKEVSELKSDYRLRDYNRLQEKFTLSRYRSMAAILANSYRREPAAPQPYINSFMRGMPVYCLTTTLLANYLPYISYSSSGMEYGQATLLNNIFPQMDGSLYEPVLTKTLSFQRGPSQKLQLRNAFPYQGGIICIEYIKRDLGGLLRAMRYADLYMNPVDNPENIHLLCMVEEKKDIFYYLQEMYLGENLEALAPDNIPYLLFYVKPEEGEK